MSNPTISMVALRDAYLSQREEIDSAVKRVLESGWYILGRETDAFEKEFAAWCGVRQAVGVGNGTDALVIALKSLGIGPGDAVFTVSHTAVATVAAVEIAGASPVLVDIDPSSYTIDPGRLEEAVRAFAASGKAGRPRAVIAVHIYGHPCDLTAITDICKRFGLFLIEDCAQAHGAMWHGDRVGRFGDMACFSFYPTKNLGAFGDGGAVVTNDDNLAERARALRQYGWRERYISDVPGMNTRLDEMQAAMLAVRLSRLDQEIAARRHVAARYDAALEKAIDVPKLSRGATHAYHLYVVRHARRNLLCAALATAGIASGVHYPVPVHLQKAYRDRVPLAPSGLGETEKAAGEVLSLPMHPFLNDEAVARVIQGVRDWTASA